MDIQAFDFAKSIRTIADYPKPGIMFRDVTTLFGNGKAFRAAIDAMALPFQGQNIDKVAGIEARGFILGGALAHALGVGFVPVRKSGKLPFATIGQDYDLEYGTDRIEIHSDAVKAGERILLVDDLIATGGTAMAAIDLLERVGAHIIAATFIIDLPDLGGRAKILARNIESFALCAFDGD